MSILRYIKRGWIYIFAVGTVLKMEPAVDITNLLEEDNCLANEYRSHKSDVTLKADEAFIGKACIKKLTSKTIKVKDCLKLFKPDRVVTVAPVGTSADYNSLQAAIDDCIAGQHTQRVRINVAPGVYDENLRFDNFAGGGSLSFGIVGDTRNIAGYSYINRSINTINPFVIATITEGTPPAAVGYTPEYGTVGGNILFTQPEVPGNTVQVNIVSPIPVNVVAPTIPNIIQQPDFSSDNVGPVIPGDRVIFYDGINPIAQERTVTRVNGNEITFDGNPLDLTRTGASITFSPNVIFRPTVPPADSQFPSVGFGATPEADNSYAAFTFAGPSNGLLYGVRLSVQVPNPAARSIYFTKGTQWQVEHCLLDDLNNVNFFNLYCQDNSLVATRTVLTVLGGLLGYSVDNRSSVQGGDLFSIGAVQAFGATYNSNIGAAGLQAANCDVAFIGIRQSMLFVTRVLAAINVRQAFQFSQQSYITDELATGIFRGNGTASSFIGLVRRDSGISFGAADAYPPQGALFQNFRNGIIVQTSSDFSSQGTVTFDAVANRYAIDDSSTYLTPNNIGTPPSPTDPSPSDIFSYTSTRGPVTSSAGTASQSGSIVTGNNTAFVPAMVGGTIIFNNGVNATITQFTSATSLTVTPAQAVANQPYIILYNDSPFPMNSAYLKQALNNAEPIILTLAPATAIMGTPIYRGKQYSITALTGAEHELRLIGATFLGGAGTATTATFKGIGAAISFTVLSNTQVAINALNNVTIS